jgi:uncharacterized protein
MAEKMRIEIAYAGPQGIYLREVLLPPGATVAMALQASDLERAVPNLDLDSSPVGIHGRKVRRDHVLRDGDRVEVYRALRIDPMQARRLRAARRDSN